MKRFTLIAAAFAALVAPGNFTRAGSVPKPEPVSAGLVAKAPFSLVGQIIFRSGESYYEGSGAVVHTRSVLTAAHNVWDPVNGWSTSVQFNRARNGDAFASRQFASRLFVLGAYRSVAARHGQDSDRSFASDLGGLRFNAAPASGAYAGWRAETGLLGAGTPVLCLGYGAQHHTGNEMLLVRSDAGFAPVTGAFMESTGLTFESGMSGGPVFSEVGPDDFRIVAIVVAGSEDPPAGGIRALDEAAAAFLAAYLRY